MLNPIVDPKRAIQLLLKRKTVTEIARNLTTEDRSRVRGWGKGEIGIGPSKAKAIADFAQRVFLAECGMPLINWKLAESTYLDDLRKADNIRESARACAYLGLLKNPGVFRFAALDVSEEPGSTCEDNVRRALLNFVGMHVLRRVAETGDRIKQHERKSLVYLALRRAEAGCDLLRHAQARQAEGQTHWSPKELTVLILYGRINLLAILSVFRKSLCPIRGFWVFDDKAAWAYVDDALVQELSDTLSQYLLGHPDRLLAAANTLVVASIRRRKASAGRAWQTMIDENPIAANLREQLPTHERPLADSPDLPWLIQTNGGTVYNPKMFIEDQP